MNIWSCALVVLILAGAVAGKYTHPGYSFDGESNPSGVPVTTLHTPATP